MNGIAYPLRVFGHANRALASARARWSALDRALTPGATVAGGVVAFVAITVWWVTQDDRLVDSATGQHILTALSYRDSVQSGDLLAPLSDFNFYPPLAHIVGMGGLLLGGVGYAGPILAENLVFVPLLALGCYGAGSVAYDRRVGVLAALFALGTPMVIAHSHVFMLDLPLTAMVAVTVWLILASDRFSRLGYSSLAGAGAGLGMMTKSTFALFVAGLLTAVLIRGGWRNWRGVGLFAAAGLAACAPWYLAHLSEVTSLTEGAVNDATYAAQNPPRWSVRNLLWYGANGFEHQLYLPLAAALVVGLVVAKRRWRRTRSGYFPELLAGGLGGYVGMTLLTIKDPRYTLPSLVFAAVLGTAWMVRSDGRLRVAAVAALAAVVIANTLSVDFGVGGSHRIRVPGVASEGFLTGELTVLAPPVIPEDGRDSPKSDGVRALLETAKRDGARQFFIGPAVDNWRSFNANGLLVMSHAIDLPSATLRGLGRRDPILLRYFRSRTDPPPCLTLDDGTSVYLAKRGPDPFKIPLDQLSSRFRLYCPPGYPGTRPPLG